MNDLDRFKEKMSNCEKEDAPVSHKVFLEFINNHFTHLRWQVSLNTKLLWLILGALIASTIADKFL